MKKTVAYIPIKLVNERLPGKNLKSFDNGEPLLTYILKTALCVNEFCAVYVYCSSEEIMSYLPEGVKFLKRPSFLDSSSTTFNDILSEFTKTIDADIYALLHATAPFITVETISKAIQAVQKGNNDSAMTVQKYNAFLWINGKPLNYDTKIIPRTQDMEPFYIETTGMYIFTKELTKQSRRVGDNPLLIEVSPIEAIDIDEPIDFEIANSIFNRVLMQ